MNFETQTACNRTRSHNQPMAEIRTMRVRRTWWDKLVLWKSAFETKIRDSQREVRGRGPTAEASREAAVAKWTAQLEASEQNEGEKPQT